MYFIRVHNFPRKKKTRHIVRCDKCDFLCSLFYVHVTVLHFVVLNCKMLGVWRTGTHLEGSDHGISEVIEICRTRNVCSRTVVL